jgi:putative membrane protein
MRIVVWLLRAFVFFALFAFALNNTQPVVVHWFFGIDWVAPQVIVVLVTFGLGCAIGVLAMVPTWWRAKRDARRPSVDATAPAGASPRAEAPPTVPMSGFDGDAPPRVGL